MSIGPIQPNQHMNSNYNVGKSDAPASGLKAAQGLNFVSLLTLQGVDKSDIYPVEFTRPLPVPGTDSGPGVIA